MRTTRTRTWSGLSRFWSRDEGTQVRLAWMRIAVVTGLFPVLWETPFLNQITGLVERGHDVDIYADQPQPGVPAHPDIARLELLRRTRYPINRLDGGRLRWPDAMRLIGQHRGGDRVTLLRTLNPFVFWKRALSLDLFRHAAAFLPRRTYDICYCPFAQDARKSLRLRRLGVLTGKLVVGLRGSDISRYVTRRGPRVYRRLFREGDLFLPVCQAFARKILALGCSPSKTIVHHTGINLNRFPYRPRQVGTDGRLRLITVGRLVEKKGIKYALGAVRRLSDAGVVVGYNIVGDGPLRQQLQHDVEQMGLQSQVRFSGWYTHSQVQLALESADVLLAPCVTAADGDEEGIPNVLREGMAAGLPVISTYHSGIPELIQDGLNGLLAPERDPVALAERVRWLADNPQAWRPMLTAARRTVEEDEIDRLNDRFVDLLNGLLRQHAGATTG
jgi:colanic acid/amylovoran biosynthesis glycosyltransferase